MSEATPPQVVRSYLGQLKAALDGVPAQVRQAILDGAAEELAGLDAAAAAARIEELGDPAFITAEARSEAGVQAGVQAGDQAGIGSDATAASVTENHLRRGDARWYIVLSSLLVAVGGVVVPLIGWVFGLAMVWVSKSWQLWEKWVATLTPPLAVAASVVISGLLRIAGEGNGATVGNGNGNGNGTGTGGGVSNPLLPSFPDNLFSTLFLLIGLNVVVGIWLLWRALRRTQTPPA